MIIHQLQIKQKSKEKCSDYQLKIADLFKTAISNVEKLVSNVFDKEKYVIHYENLQVYLRLGLKLKSNGKYKKQNQFKTFK